MQKLLRLFLLIHTAATSVVLAVDESFNSIPSLQSKPNSQPNYSRVMNPALSPSHHQDPPGFTRSVYKRDHALIPPESQVFSPLPNWVNALRAYLISPTVGSHFTMYLVKMQEDSRSALPANDVERFVFVLQGSPLLVDAYGIAHQLVVDCFAHIPANTRHLLKSDSMAVLVIFQRRYVSQDGFFFYLEQIISSTDMQPLLETAGEVFKLRKLLPTSTTYSFNIHIMDFQPGEYLIVKEVLSRKGYDGAIVDIWSCGIILFVVMAGYLTFHDQDVMATYRKIYKGDFLQPQGSSEN